MAEPTVGAFGIGVAGLVLLARFAALASMRPSVLLLVGHLVRFADRHGGGRDGAPLREE